MRWKNNVNSFVVCIFTKKIYWRPFVDVFVLLFLQNGNYARVVLSYKIKNLCLKHVTIVCVYFFFIFKFKFKFQNALTCKLWKPEKFLCSVICFCYACWASFLFFNFWYFILYIIYSTGYQLNFEPWILLLQIIVFWLIILLSVVLRLTNQLSLTSLIRYMQLN